VICQHWTQALCDDTSKNLVIRVEECNGAVVFGVWFPCAFSRQTITPRFCCCDMFPAQNIWLMTSHRSTFMIAQLCESISRPSPSFLGAFSARPLVWLGISPLARMAPRAFPHPKYATRSGLPPSIFPRWLLSPQLCRTCSVQTL